MKSLTLNICLELLLLLVVILPVDSLMGYHEFILDMAKFITTITLLAVTIIPAYTQEHADTLKTQELNEVVVEAQMQHTSPTASTYIPTSRQKNASQNAIDLLRQMAIPQIQINPLNEDIMDNYGSGVVIFINYLEASKEEMDGLRTTDVRRVEYLEFPSDPRFRGAQRVINIIVQAYAYGGYTKLTTNENFLVGFSSRNNIFSKFSYSKMTYDIYVGANNSDNHHIGNNVKGIFSLKDAYGKYYQLTRTETLDWSHYKQNEYPLTFRAAYSSEKVQIRNTVGFTHLSIPVYEQRGELTYQPSDEQNYSFNRCNPNRSNSLAYQGSFFFSLPDRFSIDISPRFNFSHNNDFLSYSTSNTPKILRNAQENIYNYRVDAYLQKILIRNILLCSESMAVTI